MLALPVAVTVCDVPFTTPYVMVMSMSNAGMILTVTDVSVGRPRISVATKSALADVGATGWLCPLGIFVSVGKGKDEG